MKNERLFRAFALLTLPIAAAIGVNCDSQQDNSGPTAITQTSEAPIPFFGGNEFIDKVVKQFGGAVLFSVLGYDRNLNMSVKFNRVDIPEFQRKEVDHDMQNLTPSQADKFGNPIYSIFAATSCEGEYKLSVSLDGGRNYTDLPVPDLITRVSSTTFKLSPETCIRPVTIDLSSGKPAA